MRSAVLVVVALVGACARREEAKPSPESKPSAAAEVEHSIEALTCRDGVLGNVAKPVSSASAPPAPSSAVSAFDADLSGMFAPIGDGGFGIGGLGAMGGTGIGFGAPRGRAIVAMPLGPHDARAMAVAKGACGHVQELRSCHDDALRPLGTAVFDLSIDATGKATVTKISGDLDETLRSCLAKALGSVTFEPGAAGTTSYSIAFESAPQKSPSLQTSPVTTSGALPPEVITRVIRSRMAQIKYCYEKALKIDPKASGKITVSFTIDPKGTVSGAKAASSTLGDATLDACIVSVFSKITFPEPTSGSVSVSYPIVLNPPS